MQDTLARHDELVRAGVTAHDGFIVKGTGDGVHAAFSASHDAIAAAEAIQRELARATSGARVPPPSTHGHPLGGSGAPRRRLLRPGPQSRRAIDERCPWWADPRVGRHRGAGRRPPSGRDASDRPGCAPVARPRAAHCVSSSSTRPIVRIAFPPCAPSIPSPRNLPAQLSSFVGRDDDVAAVGNTVTESPIVTLTGVGGVGKTRLAVHVAANLLPTYADGVWCCELAAAVDDESMEQVVAATLGVAPPRADARRERRRIPSGPGGSHPARQLRARRRRGRAPGRGRGAELPVCPGARNQS